MLKGKIFWIFGLIVERLGCQFYQVKFFLFQKNKSHKMYLKVCETVKAQGPVVQSIISLGKLLIKK